MKNLFILIFILSIKVMTAQDIIVQIQRPPQYTFCLENIWNITLTNNTGRTLNVYLLANTVEEKSGLIAVAQTGKFLLNPGIKRVLPSDIKPITIKETNPKYTDVVENQNILPNGKYTICINVIDFETGLILGEGCINNLEIMHLTNMRLLLPISKGTVNDHLPVFSWLPPVPVPSGKIVTYNLYISEILNKQTNYDALQSNPLFFKQMDIYGTVYQYPLRSIKFEPGRRYAWKVQALVDNIIIAESEVREFTYINDSNKIFTPTVIQQDSNHISKKNPPDDNSTAGGFNVLQKRKLFSYSVNSTVEGYVSDRDNINNEIPKNYANWTLNPTVRLFDVPFGLNIFLSTQNKSSRQNVNAISFSFQPEALKTVIQEETQKMTEEELPWLMKFLSDFRAFQIGVTYPDYTPYSVSNVPVTGVNIEYNPGLFYIAISGLKNQRAVDNTAFKRNLYSGRMGIGRKEESHLYFTMMYARDDENSIKVDSSNMTLTPMSNMVFGIDGKISLFDDDLSINAEAVGSYLNRDINSPDLETNSIPDWLKNIVHPTISGQIDYMFSVNASYNNRNLGSKISAGVKMVGPGFVSLGSIKRDNDEFSFEVGYDQSLLDNRITFTSLFQHYHDNIIPIKTYRTIANTIMFNLLLNFENFPYLNILYSPYFQSNNATDEYRIDNTMHILSAGIGYSYTILGLGNSTMYSFSMNDLNSWDGVSDSRSMTHMVSQSVSFSFPLSLTGSLSHTQNKYRQMNNNNTWLDFNAGYVFKENWRNIIGFNAAVNNDNSNKLGFYFNSSANLFSLIKVNIKLEKSIYKDKINNLLNKDDLIFVSTIIMNL